jgi:hypothetical protein
VVTYAKTAQLLEKAAALWDKATRALRLAVGLQDADQARLKQFADELWEQAVDLERQAGAEAPSRSSQPSRDRTQNVQVPKKGRGGSNDRNPQS